MKDFAYDLPESNIAQHPLAERDASKLLVYRDGKMIDDTYRNLSQFIPEGALLIFNNSKVIPARLLFTTATGASIEIFCLEPAKENAEITTAMQQQGSVEWKCLVGRLAKWKEPTLSITTESFTLFATKKEQSGNAYIIEFSWTPTSLSFANILEHFGAMPIPPYLKRAATANDSTRYQTIYAAQQGAVAAPTAGLHFTEAVFNSLKTKQTQIAYITLHVGAGTFKPVKGDTIADHEMHSEWIEVETVLIQQIIQQISNGLSVISVGTTSLRTIESLYWMGVKTFLNPNISIHELPVKQWEVYSLPQDVEATTVLQSLLQ
jgi:S-adenosylmethionine:tRNA ribosyltransferase-isomerase